MNKEQLDKIVETLNATNDKKVFKEFIIGPVAGTKNYFIFYNDYSYKKGKDVIPYIGEINEELRIYAVKPETIDKINVFFEFIEISELGK
jgi:hypothetical protein